MIILQAEERGCDEWGCGNYGASRGNRKHKGMDFKAESGQILLSTVVGEVSKLGYPYSDDLDYRYVQVTDAAGYDIRFFYIDPSIRLGDKVMLLDPLGEVQDLSNRYPEMTNHVHIEIKKGGRFYNPEAYFS